MKIDSNLEYAHRLQNHQLRLAMEVGDLEMIHEAFIEGALPNIPFYPEGHTALGVAARGGKADIIDLLINLSADPDARTHRGKTPLMLACLYGHSEAVRALIRGGAETRLLRCTGKGTYKGWTSEQFANFAFRNDVAPRPSTLKVLKLLKGFDLTDHEDRFAT